MEIRIEAVKDFCKQKQIIWIACGIFIILAIFLFTGQRQLGPEVLQESLDRTARANSYSFTARIVMQANGKDRVLSDIKGEKVGEQRHFTGQMLKTPVSVYVSNGKLYIKDPFGKWLVIDETDQEKAQTYISELNPLGLMNIKNIGRVLHVAKVDLHGQTVYKFDIEPDVNHPSLEVMYTGFKASIWVDPEEKLVYMARFYASSKTDIENGLDVRITFRDYNQEFNIKPPAIN